MQLINLTERNLRYFLSIIFFLLLSIQYANAQKEASIWYFGRNAGVDFNSGALVALTDGALVTDEGCATISDKNGNLLFYTDGITVWNRNHLTMPNGTGLNGDPSSTQSAIIVPKSDEPNIYYVFTVDNVGGPNGLQYNVIDMNLDSGLGNITAQKNILLRNSVSEKITAVENSSGTGVWVISKAWESNAFYAFLVDSSGVNTTPVISNIGSTPSINNREAIGYLKASSNGTLLASATSYEGVVELFRFNSTAGAISDLISLKSFFEVNWYDREPYGVEFSTNNKVLYVSTKGGIYQFDISNYDQASISASGLMITPLNSLPPFLGALQMGINGKIYTTRAYRSYLNVINDPNVLGMGCNYQEMAVDLGTDHLGVSGLPPFITSYFDVGIEADNFCSGDATSFSIDSGGTITSIAWDFGDGNTSTLETPNHVYAASGNYTVNVTVNTTTGTSSDTKEIIIYDTPIANPVSDFEICSSSPTYEFDLSSKDSEILGSQTATAFTIAYYPSSVDAQNETNSLPLLYTNTNAVETIIAKISNTVNPSCSNTTSFDLIVKTAPVLNPTTDWTVCDTDTDGFYDFDLTRLDPEILDRQNTASFAVSYHETLADAQSGAGELVSPYTNTAPSQLLFFRIENIAHTECFETGSFSIEVNTAVTANTPSDMEACDDNNDGFFNFDLSGQDSLILDGQDTSSFIVSYYASRSDADNAIAALDKMDYTNTSPYLETVFARVQNRGNPMCYATTSFDLTIGDSPALQNVADWEVCDGDNDGIKSFDLKQKDSEVLGDQAGLGFTVTYHLTQSDADNNINAITGAYRNTANPQTLFYRIGNNDGTSCYVTDSFILEVLEVPTAGAPSPITVCDDNESGTRTFDLSVKDPEVLNGQDADSFVVSYFASRDDAENDQNSLSKEAYTNSRLRETIYARIENRKNGECFDTTGFDIGINPLSRPDLEETFVICPDSPGLTIDGGDFESWSWRDDNGVELESGRTLDITALGDHTLTVTQTTNGITCERTVPFEVVSSGAPEDFTTEIGDPSDNVTITVNAIGTGEFEYSSDGENYQDSNRLEVFPGEHTVYVRDRFLCRTISKEVIALGYLKFFTPNGDGIHEFWKIIGANNYPGSQLYIHDRYGKLLQQISPTALGWDGTYNGLPLPASDYWFRYMFDGGKTFTGHFSLKR